MPNRHRSVEDVRSFNCTIRKFLETIRVTLSASSSFSFAIAGNQKIMPLNRRYSCVNDGESRLQPLISIITVVCNANETINDTIQSVVNQSYKNIEYIVVDGGSKDGTIDIIQRYENKLSNWVSEKDSGIYDAMNKGIALAHGNWVIFLNSGDSFANDDVLERVVSENRDHSVQIIYGNTRVKDTNNSLRPPKSIHKRFFFYETLCHQSVFFKREVFEKYGYFDLKYKIIADREWLLRATMQNIRYSYVDLDICIWDAAGYSSDNISLYVKENIDLRMSYFSLVERLILPWVMRYNKLRRKAEILLSY